MLALHAKTAAAKAGMVGLVRRLASEYGPRNLYVNALLPGGTDTPMGRTFIDDAETLRFVTGCALLADGDVSITRV